MINKKTKVSEKVQTNKPLPRKYKIFERTKMLIQKPCKILGILLKFHFLYIHVAPTANKRICRGHSVSPDSE